MLSQCQFNLLRLLVSVTWHGYLVDMLAWAALAQNHGMAKAAWCSQCWYNATPRAMNSHNANTILVPRGGRGEISNFPSKMSLSGSTMLVILAD